MRDYVGVRAARCLSVNPCRMFVLNCLYSFIYVRVYQDRTTEKQRNSVADPDTDPVVLGHPDPERIRNTAEI